MGKPLDVRQDNFCIHCTTIGMLEFGNGTPAAIAARYAEADAAVLARKLLKDKRTISRISQLHSGQVIRPFKTIPRLWTNVRRGEPRV
jgi:hypothetical protein